MCQSQPRCIMTVCTIQLCNFCPLRLCILSHHFVFVNEQKTKPMFLFWCLGEKTKLRTLIRAQSCALYNFNQRS